SPVGPQVPPQLMLVLRDQRAQPFGRLPERPGHHPGALAGQADPLVLGTHQHVQQPRRRPAGVGPGDVLRRPGQEGHEPPARAAVGTGGAGPAPRLLRPRRARAGPPAPPRRRGAGRKTARAPAPGPGAAPPGSQAATAAPTGRPPATRWTACSCAAARPGTPWALGAGWRPGIARTGAGARPRRPLAVWIPWPSLPESRPAARRKPLHPRRPSPRPPRPSPTHPTLPTHPPLPTLPPGP